MRASARSSSRVVPALFVNCVIPIFAVTEVSKDEDGGNQEDSDYQFDCHGTWCLLGRQGDVRVKFDPA